MKIGLIVCGDLGTISGGFLYDRQLVASLRSAGDSVEVIQLARRGYAGQLAENLTFRVESHLDIVLQDELAHPSLLIPNRRMHPGPIISIVHNLRSAERRPNWQNLIYRTMERLYLGSVDGFVFNSAATRMSVEALIDTRLPYVIATPGGDRLGEMSMDQINSRALEAGPLRLLFLANVTGGKGLQVLLKALTQLAPTDCALDVVGSCDVEPEYAGRMQRFARELGLWVSFLGPLDHKQLQQRLRHAQVLVVPSFYEGFGIAYLEGMAHGLPAIGTLAGAIPEIIADGSNGYLIRPGDANQLAACLRKLIENRALLARLSMGALRSYKSKPTWSDSTRRIREFLMSILQERASAAS